jgi:hypothetical protein
MIISESKRIIFIHNPKCAGTSVRGSLRQFDTRADYYWLFGELDGKKIDKAHMPLNILRRFSLEDFDLLRSYFVFGFVRDPYSRAVSSFNESRNKIYKDFISGNMSLDEYVRELNNFFSDLTSDKVSGWDIGYRHFVRQKDMFWLDGKCFADLIIRVEEIDPGVDALEALVPDVAVKLRKDISAKKNVKPMEYSAIELLSSASIDIISHIYKDDFKVFGYPLVA